MRKFELIREYYGLTQQEVADALGVSKAFISKFEKGEKTSQRCEDFYTHKHLRPLCEKKYGVFTPIREYIDFVLESTAL